MTDEPYFDPIEAEENAAKNPETAPQKVDDWPKTQPGNEPTDPDSEAESGAPA